MLFMIEVSHLTVCYGTTTVLRDVSLTVPAGSTVVLVGPSGCGKSTLIRCMNGLLRPVEGTVTFQDQPVAMPQLISQRHQMGYVIQEGGLFPHLTARQNVTLMARQLGWEHSAINRRLEELRTLAHLDEDNLDRYPVQLSGGQRQRVSLMRALMLDPDLLLLDEPLGALDPMIRAELQQDLSEIFRTLNKSVVMVTHDMHEAAFFAGTVVLMRDGEIVQQGTVDDLLCRPADPFVTRFIEAQSAVPLLDRGTAQPEDVQ
ncbi:MAG: ATP-binding cassette domain-containing protein [Planctomycetaceae bacterium]|nr:ATP-binding cassette domain-containing protein [Planctomycetaceae bacterium]